MNDEGLRHETSESGSERFGANRKPRLATRLRSVVRKGIDRVLAADLVWSAAFVLILLLLIESRYWGTPYGPFAAGQVAPHDTTALHDFEIQDEELTERRKLAARESVPDVYVFDGRRVARLADELASVFEEGRRILDSNPAATGEDPWALLAQRVDAEALERLRRRGFSAEIERTLAGSLERVERALIVANKTLLERQPSILVMRAPGGAEESLSDFGAIVDLDEARLRVREEVLASPSLDPDDRETLATFLAGFVDASLSFDPRATTVRKEAAAASVPPVRIRIPEGTVLAGEGERITPEKLQLLHAARRAAERRFGVAEIAGMLTVLSMLAFFLYRYAHYHQRQFKRMQHLHALLVLVLLLTMLVAQGMLSVVRFVVDNMAEPYNHLESYTYLIPLGAGAILIALLANGRIAIVYSAYASILFGALEGWDALRVVWAFVVQLAGIYAISTYRERAALLRAGLVVGGAGAAAALAVEVLRFGADPMPKILFEAGLAFVGGAVGVGLLVSFVLPVFEGLFHVLTDIRLLELSNVNHPLLAELALKAPGSYNHSLVVGTLAQEGAKAIGANSLFCRVAALYHDIGKIRKPEYYVENQREGNPHDRLSPSMSALVIAAHVKDGIKIARDAGLPEQIVDIIPQHHGTRLMTYFYDKALKRSAPARGSVSEDDFRYPGPKPHTAEAAIFMLADAVEAAARTVEEPTPGHLGEVIRKVTNAVVLDRQLDACDLTFADLQKIQDAFLRTLLGMHHHRLDYPGFVFGGGEGSESRRPGAPDQQRAAQGAERWRSPF